MRKRKKKYTETVKKDIRLIGLDLDGTALTTDKVLTPRTREDIEKCLEKGIVVLPATGRVRSGIPESITQIEGIRYAILSNGGSVIDLKENKIVYRNCIAWDRALALFDILEKYNTFYDVYADGAGWCEGRFYDNLEEFRIEPQIQKLIKVSRNRIDNLREWMQENKAPIEKINMFFAREEDRQRAFHELEKEGDLAATCSLNNNLEINHATCNKGDAMIRLGEYLSIAPENCMACGDGNNDIEMVELAGVGVAMENGVRALKRRADYVTKRNDEEGVAYAIEKFCL